MSKIADDLYASLKRLFPRYTIVKEVYVKYKQTRLFFDFFIKEFGLYIEVQGQQHVLFNAHFHGTKENYWAQKKRDNLKIEYTQQNDNLSLVRFYYSEKITDALIMNKIDKALDRGFYE